MVLELCKEFGNNIRKYRKEAGLSQEALAESIEIGTTSLSLVETGKGFVTAKTLEKIAVTLGVEVSQLFSYVKDSDMETFYYNILQKVEKFKDNKDKLTLLNLFLDAL